MKQILTNSRQGKQKWIITRERLFLCHVGEKSKKYENLETINEFSKSPLNYTGGKHKLLSQLIEKFPNKIETFVDLFGGGFNVGVNVKADKIIYNDKQKKLLVLSSCLRNIHILKSQKIEKNIERYGLSNTLENGYKYYQCNSDSGVERILIKLNT